MKILLLLLTILSGINVACADQLNIKGIRLGMSQEEVIALQGAMSCSALKSKSDTGCYGHATYADVGAKLFVFFKEGKVTAVSVTVDSDDFENVTLALKEKLGKPSFVKTEKVQNLAGAEFNNPSFHWVKNGGILSATKFSEKVTESGISLSEFNVVNTLKKHKDDIKKKSQDL
ncbi:MAG: hypothetical protein ABL877_08100 [Thiobacillus sp.]